MGNHSITEFGARSGALSTQAIQAAVDACAAEGGGTALIPGGIWLSGTVFLRSNVSLEITAGATLKMSADPADFPDFDCAWDKTKAPRGSSRCFLYIGGCENTAVCGLGRIDCSGSLYCEPDPNAKANPTDPFRVRRMRRIHPDSPGRMIFVMESRNVTLADFSLCEMAGGWGIWVNHSVSVNIRSLKLDCCPDYPNSDGIHINCSRDVFVTDCAVHSGEDALVVRAATNTLGEDVPCENILVKGCSLSSNCQAVRIGWKGDGLIRSCLFSDLVITHSRDAITIELPSGYTPHDTGSNTTRIEHLSFQHILISDTWRHPVKMVISEEVRCAYIRDIRFSDLDSTTQYYPRLEGRADVPLERISFDRCRFTVLSHAQDSFLPRHVAGLHMDADWCVQ